MTALQQQTGELLYSSLAGDEILGELVEMFVAEMPDRIRFLEGSFVKEDRDALRCAAHQLKGAAGSYGFHQLTAPASLLETALQKQQPIETVRQTLESLISACSRIRAGQPVV